MNIEQLIEGHLRLARKSAKNYMMAACPVHKNGQERNPSFSVNIRTGSYRCFTCGIRGDLQSLLKLIGANTAVELEQEDEAPTKPSLTHIPAEVLSIFRLCPNYMVEAGFSKSILSKYDIGFDFSTYRVTFPIFDESGNLVAISGRTVIDQQPRYKVYTQQMLAKYLPDILDYDYSPKPKEHLWGLHLVPNNADELVLVEGYKACLWLAQFGIENVVATMGTAVTEKQIQLIVSRSIRVTIAFDMDIPGRTAAKNLQLRLHRFGIPARILEYPAKQPDGLTAAQVKTLFNSN